MGLELVSACAAAAGAAAITACWLGRQPLAAAASSSSQCPAKQRQQAADTAASGTSGSTGPSGVEDGVDVSIEYCVGCRWMLRSAWIGQELLTTFASSKDESERLLRSVSLVPSKGNGGGVFRVTATPRATGQQQLLWDRKAEGGFPEAKELKQRLRDVVNPSQDLGHSDKK